MASLHQKATALVFSSGYVANQTAIATIAQCLPGCIIFSDSENHNSMIDGVRRAGCDKQLIYRYYGGMDGLVDAIGGELARWFGADAALIDEVFPRLGYFDRNLGLMDSA